MSATKDAAIDAANESSLAAFKEKMGDLNKWTKTELIARVQDMMTMLEHRDRYLHLNGSRISDLEEELALLKEQDQTTALQATIAQHEKTIGDLERRVKDLSQYEHLATQLVGSNAQLSATVHNISRMGAALVPTPNVTMTPR